MRHYIETSDSRIIYVTTNLHKVNDNNDEGLVECIESPISITVIDSNNIVTGIPINIEIAKKSIAAF